jgi:hypothetical protein
MPVVFRHKGFRFVFYSNEGDSREPGHIHAIKAASTLGPYANSWKSSRSGANLY